MYVTIESQNRRTILALSAKPTINTRYPTGCVCQLVTVSVLQAFLTALRFSAGNINGRGRNRLAD